MGVYSIIFVFIGINTLNILIRKVGVDPQLRRLADFQKVPGLSPSTLGLAGTPVLGNLMPSSGLREHCRKMVHRHTYSQTDRHQGTVKVCECKMHNSIRLAQQKVVLEYPKP